MKSGLFLRLVLAVLVIDLALLSIGGKGCNPWEKDDTTSGSSGVGPFDLVATVVSSSQINLTWKHNLDPVQEPAGTGFELQRKTGAADTYQTIATLGLVTSYEDTPLSTTTTYYYRTRVYHTVGGDKVQYSNWSNEAFAETHSPPVVSPAAPSGLTATAISSSQINLTWTDNSDNENGFKIERSPDDVIYTQIDVVGPDIISYSDMGLTTNTTYYYQIRAYNTAGASPYSNEAFATTQAEVVPWLGTRQLGTNLSDEAYGVATDTSGNIYITGFTSADLDGNTSAGGTDLFVTKYSPSGEKQWTRQLGSTSGDMAFGGVTIDTSGNIYVAGRTAGDLDGTNAGAQDLFVVKYNTDGDWQWTRQLGTATNDEAYGVATDTNDNIYVVGHTAGDLDGTNAGSYDLFVVKYNTNGDWQWTKQLGTAAGDYANGVATDTSGNIYVAGYTAGSFPGFTNLGGNDLFVVKYNTDGDWQWTKQLGTASDDGARDVTIDTSNNIYVAGYTEGDLDGTNAGMKDIFVLKYNSAGVKQWTKQLGTISDDYAEGVAVDTSGNIYVAGKTSGDLDGNTNAGGADLFVTKYSPAGVKQWTRQLGTAWSDYAYGVATYSSDNIYVTGRTGGGLDGNTNAGDTDFFVVKYNSAGEKQ